MISRGEYQRIYYANNREKILGQIKRRHLLSHDRFRLVDNLSDRKRKEKRFGVSYPTWWLCDICNRPLSLFSKHKQNQISLDHNHKTGKFRGWICNSCNWRLGMLENSILREAAEKYLKRVPN